MAINIFENMNLAKPTLDYLRDSDVAGNETPETLLKVSDLVPFENHPFKVDTEAPDFEELVESVRENGVIVPIIVRTKGNGKYEIISGHRRAEACKLAGITEVSAMIKDLDDYMATIVMVHSNLYRPEVSIAEKTRAYRMWNDAEEHVHGRAGINVAATISEQASVSRATVFRYIRLSYLVDELLDLVDAKKMPINAGMEISYLDADSQTKLASYISEYGIIPNNDQAAKIRKECEAAGGKLTYELITPIMLQNVAKPSSKVTFKSKDLANYFKPDTDAASMTGVIVKLLEMHKDDILSGKFD